jgi:hypothetical protein
MKELKIKAKKLPEEQTLAYHTAGGATNKDLGGGRGKHGFQILNPLDDWEAKYVQKVRYVLARNLAEINFNLLVTAH